MNTEEIQFIGKKENKIKEDLINKISSFYNDAFKEDLEDGFIDNADIDKKIEGEKSFYLKVLNSLDKSIDENREKENIVLFDIDETIATNKETRDGYKTVLRPSIISLFYSIKEKGADIGFLTNRTEIKDQLENDLKDLQNYIKEDYIFSSRGTFVSQQEEELIRSKTPKDLRINNIGDFEKIKFLNDLIEKEENKNKVFIPVDDLPYPLIFKNGVSLSGNEKFFI